MSVPSDSEMTADRLQQLRRRVKSQALTICPAEKPPLVEAEPERGGSFEETVAAWRWLADRGHGEPVGGAALHDRLRTLAWAIAKNDPLPRSAQSEAASRRRGNAR